MYSAFLASLPTRSCLMTLRTLVMAAGSDSVLTARIRRKRLCIALMEGKSEGGNASTSRPFENGQCGTKDAPQDQDLPSGMEQVRIDGPSKQREVGYSRYQMSKITVIKQE
jgi:hypothetical protein